MFGGGEFTLEKFKSIISSEKDLSRFKSILNSNREQILLQNLNNMSIEKSLESDSEQEEFDAKLSYLPKSFESMME